MLTSLRTLPCGMLIVAAAGAARSLFGLFFSAFLLSAMASGALAQPTNDAFANATDLPLATVLTGSNLGATKEVDEPDHGDDGGGSVWWKFTPTVSKRFVLDLAGSDYAAIAGIYTGSAVGSLTSVAGQAHPVDLPRISFSAIAGTTYYIAVDGWKDGANPHATGNISIRINRVLIVTPEAASFEGPEGGPFTPSSITFTLTAPAGLVDIEIENGSSWADLDETEIVGLHTTPVTITLTPNESAYEKTPGLNFAQLHLFPDPGPGSEVRNLFLFVEPPSSGNHTISLTANPAAGGTVTGAGTFASGSSRTVTATPGGAYLFTKWTEGSATVSTARSYTFTLNANRTLVAHFALKRTLAVSANPAAGGTVTGGGTFAHGSSRTVTATPKPGYEFLNWTQGANQVAITRSYTFTLTANRTLRANFKSRNDLLVDFGGNGLQRRLNNAGAWLKIHNASPLAIATGDLDGSGKDEAIASFPGGLFARYNNVNPWKKLHNSAPVRVVTGDLDGNGKDEIVASFAGGVFARFNNVNPWVRLHASSAQGLAVGDLDGNGKEDLLADLSTGLWARRNNSATWVRLHPTSPIQIATGDLDGNGKDEVIAAFPSGIFARYNNAGGFVRLTTAVAQGLATGDLDGNGKDELLVDLGAGGFSARYNNSGGFVRLRATNPVRILAADLDRNGKAEAIASFPSIGLHARYNNSGAFVRLSPLIEQGIAAGGFD